LKPQTSNRWLREWNPEIFSDACGIACFMAADDAASSLYLSPDGPTQCLHREDDNWNELHCAVLYEADSSNRTKCCSSVVQSSFNLSVVREDSNFQIKEKSSPQTKQNSASNRKRIPERGNNPIDIFKIASVPSFPSPLPCIYGYGPQPQPCILASFRFAGACLL
jgi:hypothetical protein